MPAQNWIVLLWLLLGVQPLPAGDPVVPLVHAHAHNDYEHRRPLFDALDHGFCSVEADVFLVDGKLLVGHTPSALKPERTLETLYLDPLRERARTYGGQIYPNGPTFFLLIDVKTAADPTYAVLDPMLARYGDLVTAVRDGMVERKAVTVVISGNRPQRKQLAGQKTRYAGIDGRLTDLDATDPADLLPWVSDRWSAHFRWQGEGPPATAERQKLRELVAKAHARGRLVRFWGTPEKEEVWKELRAAGVDLLNTDQLDDMQRFLLRERAGGRLP